MRVTASLIEKLAKPQPYDVFIITPRNNSITEFMSSLHVRKNLWWFVVLGKQRVERTRQETTETETRFIGLFATISVAL